MKFLILNIIHFPELFIIIYFISFFFLNKYPKLKRVILINSFLLIFSTFPFISYLLEKPLYLKENFVNDNLNISFSIILVPAGGIINNEITKNILPTKDSINRFIDAKNLNKKLNLPILIAGGKTIENYKSEAKVIQEYFNEEDNQQIYIEEQSLNTNETARNLIKILEKKKLNKNIILVTDKSHIKRMASVLRNNDINVYIPKELTESSLTTKDFVPKMTFLRMNIIKYEYIGLIYYLYKKNINFKNLNF